MDPLSAAVAMMPPSLSYQPSFFDLPWRRKSVGWADTEMGEFIGDNPDKRHNSIGGGSITKGGASLRYTDLADGDSDSDSSIDPKDDQGKDDKDKNKNKKDKKPATGDNKKASPHKLERTLKRNSVRSVSPYLGGNGFDVRRGSRVLI